MKLIECVPNFSEGRDEKVLAAIRDAISSVEGVRFLDLDKGADTNRTVMTFVGAPEQVLESAFRGIAKASELIDMSKHRGAHPRMGACDVCPFIPVRGSSMQECVELARRLAKRVGQELGIPVYLYEYAASCDSRKNLAYLRHGEYEGLQERFEAGTLLPDFGSKTFNEQVKRSGATVIGARDFLIAYNINLNTLDKRKANDLAFRLREKGRSARSGNTSPDYFRGDIRRYSIKNKEFPCALCNAIYESHEELQSHSLSVHNHDWLDFMQKQWELRPEDLEGQALKEPGLFTHCKAIGWVVESLGCAQVSINLTNFRTSPPHLVLEACRELATKAGLVVTGSEIVGLIPFDALYEAGLYYLARQRSPRGVPVRDVLDLAVKSMGLDDLSPFVLEQKVLGLPSEEGKLAQSSLEEYSAECSRASVAPGGGSVSALVASLGAALFSMVCNLNVGRKNKPEEWAHYDELGLKFQGLRQRLMLLVDEDANAFNGVIAARRLPNNNAEERAARNDAIQEAYKAAIQTPLNCAKLASECLELGHNALEAHKLDEMVSDLGVAAQLARAAFAGGMYNVLVNLKSIEDKIYVNETKQLLKELEQKVEKQARMIEHEIMLLLDGIYVVDELRGE
ncbi:MAG: glutamate formimidoyltransferase [Bradymonadales bacterium]